MTTYTAFFVRASMAIDRRWMAEDLHAWEFSAQSEKAAEKMSFDYADERQWDVVTIIPLPRLLAAEMLTEMLAEADRRTLS